MNMTTEAALVTEATDPHCLTPTEVAALLQGAPWLRLVIIGDSVAAGVRSPVDGYRDLSSSDRIAEALREQQPALFYRNLAEREKHVAEIRDQQLSKALELEPDLVIVSAGGNDALRRSFDPDLFAGALAGLLGPLRDAGALSVTIGLFDLGRSGLVPEPYAAPLAERFDRLDGVTAAVALDHGAIHVDNHHHPLGTDPSIYASDRMHGNARGHAVAAANLIKALAAATVQGATVIPVAAQLARR
jgi:lysophospholipase L1-like esterase